MYLTKHSALRGAGVIHLADADGQPLCGAKVAGDDWTLQRTAPPWRRLCAWCHKARLSAARAA